MQLDPKFWKTQPRAIKSTYEDVNDRFAVVEMACLSAWDENSWGCIDKQFSVGHTFALKTTKEAAIKFCQDF
jgi:hypothetical protein